MAGFAARWIPRIVHEKRLKDAPFMDALTQMIARATPAIYEGQVQALLARPDFRPLLPRIFRPTLVLCGRQDRWSDVAQHEEIAKAILGADLQIVEECGHMATIEQPDAVTGLMADWLRR
jgi:pimeloyl-ACP methyl ester carboxylesterase